MREVPPGSAVVSNTWHMYQGPGDIMGLFRLCVVCVCVRVYVCGECAVRCVALTGVPPAQDWGADWAVLLSRHEVLL